MTASPELQNGIASLVILGLAVLFVVYNKWLANKFADQFLSDNRMGSADSLPTAITRFLLHWLQDTVLLLFFIRG